MAALADIMLRKLERYGADPGYRGRRFDMNRNSIGRAGPKLYWDDDVNGWMPIRDDQGRIMLFFWKGKKGGGRNLNEFKWYNYKGASAWAERAFAEFEETGDVRALFMNQQAIPNLDSVRPEPGQFLDPMDVGDARPRPQPVPEADAPRLQRAMPPREAPTASAFVAENVGENLDEALEDAAAKVEPTRIGEINRAAVKEIDPKIEFPDRSPTGRRQIMPPADAIRPPEIAVSDLVDKGKGRRAAILGGAAALGGLGLGVVLNRMLRGDRTVVVEEPAPVHLDEGLDVEHVERRNMADEDEVEVGVPNPRRVFREVVGGAAIGTLGLGAVLADRMIHREPVERMDMAPFVPADPDMPAESVALVNEALELAGEGKSLTPDLRQRIADDYYLQTKKWTQRKPAVTGVLPTPVTKYGWMPGPPYKGGVYRGLESEPVGHNMVNPRDITVRVPNEAGELVEVNWSELSAPERRKLLRQFPPDKKGARALRAAIAAQGGTAGATQARRSVSQAAAPAARRAGAITVQDLAEAEWMRSGGIVPDARLVDNFREELRADGFKIGRNDTVSKAEVNRFIKSRLPEYRRRPWDNSRSFKASKEMVEGKRDEFRDLIYGETAPRNLPPEQRAALVEQGQARSADLDQWERSEAQRLTQNQIAREEILDQETRGPDPRVQEDWEIEEELDAERRARSPDPEPAPTPDPEPEPRPEPERPSQRMRQQIEERQAPRPAPEPEPPPRRAPDPTPEPPRQVPDPPARAAAAPDAPRRWPRLGRGAVLTGATALGSLGLSTILAYHLDRRRTSAESRGEKVLEQNPNSLYVSPEQGS